MPTIKAIIEEYIDTTDYDGLYHPSGDCGCKRDNLGECPESASFECKAGYISYDHCDEEGYAFRITEDKPTIAKEGK